MYPIRLYFTCKKCGKSVFKELPTTPAKTKEKIVSEYQQQTFLHECAPGLFGILELIGGRY